MKIEDLMNLELNTIVNYSAYKNVFYKGKDERHVHLEDKFGGKIKIYIELFLKYGHKET